MSTRRTAERHHSRLSRHLDAAVVSLQKGDKLQAERMLERLSKENPDHPKALGLYGGLLQDAGRFAEAMALLQRAVELAPGVAAYWWNLGAACQDAGLPGAALEAWHRAIALDPGRWELYFNVAGLLERQGEWSRAEEFYRLALRRNDKSSAVWAGLGRICARLGRSEEAVVCFNESLELAPTAEAYSDLAQTLTSMGHPDAALASARAAIGLNPRLALARCQEGRALREMARFVEARQAFEAAVALHVDCADAWEGLALANDRLCDTDRAVSCFVRAMEIQPGRSFTHSSLLFTLSATSAASPERLLDAHQDWARLHASQLPAFRHAAEGENPARRLRIGFVSGDLRDHAMRFFISPILRGLDRGQFEVICYSNCGDTDSTTAQLRELADRWHNVAALADGELAMQIRNDCVDILVDLSGHTRDNRLLVFARKPAPVQVSYLGYLNTTGLSQMDYWITDWVVHPANTPQRTTESIWRLPRCWVCYEPPEDGPQVAERDGSEPVTFASFNAARKLGSASLRLWGRVLAALPESRLLIKADGLQFAADRAHMQERLANCGIHREQVALVGRTPSREEHLALFGKVDVALDTVAWSGGTTTVETLWMGVPVVTLAGDLMPCRMSASMLHAVGLDDCIALNEDAFVRIAVALAEDPSYRGRLRRELRARIAASPLCEGPGLSTSLGDAFRQMWMAWCSPKEKEVTQ